MTPLVIESFELYQGTSAAGFARYLTECGYTVTGLPAPAPDRTTFAVAADLSQGGFSFPVSTTDPVVAFGFAVRYDEPGDVWRINDDLVLTLDEYPLLSGIAGPNKISANRWLFAEVLIRKGDNLVDLYLNDQLQLSVAMPQSLRFLTAFRPTFIARQGLIVDDVYAAAGGRMGPISTTAHFSLADLPWAGDTKGDQVSSDVNDSVTGDDIKLVAVKARASRTDLDNRRVATFAGEQLREVSVSTEEAYRQGVFATQPNGSPWTPAAVAALSYGVRITN